jgi:hypothetical protein
MSASAATVDGRRHHARRWRLGGSAASEPAAGDAEGGGSSSRLGTVFSSLDAVKSRMQTGRRPVRSCFARISESLVDAPLAPRPLFELALK